MATYCWQCPECGRRSETDYRPSRDLYCPQHEECIALQRDYRAEGVGLSGMVTLKREREEGGASAVRDLFLPTQKDFERPSDPDGKKGLRNWRETHEPKEGNKKPMWPGGESPDLRKYH